MMKFLFMSSLNTSIFSSEAYFKHILKARKTQEKKRSDIANKLFLILQLYRHKYDQEL